MLWKFIIISSLIMHTCEESTKFFPLFSQIEAPWSAPNGGEKVIRLHLSPREEDDPKTDWSTAGKNSSKSFLRYLLGKEEHSLPWADNSQTEQNQDKPCCQDAESKQTSELRDVRTQKFLLALRLWNSSGDTGKLFTLLRVHIHCV